MEEEPVSAELVAYEGSTELATVFGVDRGSDVIDAAVAMAKPLAAVIDDRKLFTQIRGKKHVRVEGWTLLGAMVGVHAATDYVKPFMVGDVPYGYEAKVEVRRGDTLVASAIAICTRSEKTWKERDDYALLSMAQTRATSKALKQALSFVMELAGFDSTPAEEMPKEEATPEKEAPPPAKLQALIDDGVDPKEILKQARKLTKERGKTNPIRNLGVLSKAPDEYLDELVDRILANAEPEPTSV